MFNSLKKLFQKSTSQQADKSSKAILDFNPPFLTDHWAFILNLHNEPQTEVYKKVTEIINLETTKEKFFVARGPEPLVGIKLYDSNLGFVVIPLQEKGYTNAYPVLVNTKSIETRIEKVKLSKNKKESMLCLRYEPAVLNLQLVDTPLSLVDLEKQNLTVYPYALAVKIEKFNPEEYSKNMGDERFKFSEETTMLMPSLKEGYTNYYSSIAKVKEISEDSFLDQKVYILNLKLAGDESFEINIDLVCNQSLLNFIPEVNKQVFVNFSLYGYGETLKDFIESAK